MQYDSDYNKRIFTFHINETEDRKLGFHFEEPLR